MPPTSTFPPGTDKFLHFMEFFIWSVFLRLAHTRRTGKGLRVLFLAVLFASFMEFYQSMIPGRSAEFFDVLADIAGALVGQSVLEPGYPPPRSTIIID